MFPHRRMPCHITVLYVYSIVSLLALFHATLVAADVIVISPDTNGTAAYYVDFELSFAASVPNDGIKGLIVMSNPPEACKIPEKPPFQLNSTLKWFLLIKRYHPCALEKQVLHAQEAGYNAAVIYNSRQTQQHSLSTTGGLRLGLSHQDLLLMTVVHSTLSSSLPSSSDSQSPSESSISIPAVLIGEDDGLSIKSNYLYDHGFIIIIYPDTPFNLNSYLLPFAIVIGICFLVLLLFLVIRCIKERRRSRRNRLSSKHLKQIPTTKFKKGDQYDVCAICLEEYNEGEKLRILPCSHAYHAKCVDPWLTNNRRTCPVCKRKIPLDGHASDSDSDSEGYGPPSETSLLLPSSRRRNDGGGTTDGGTFSGPFANPLNEAYRDAGASRATPINSGGSSPRDTPESSCNASSQSRHTTCVELHLSTEESEEVDASSDAATSSPGLPRRAYMSVNGDEGSSTEPEGSDVPVSVTVGRPRHEVQDPDGPGSRDDASPTGSGRRRQDLVV